MTGAARPFLHLPAFVRRQNKTKKEKYPCLLYVSFGSRVRMGDACMRVDFLLPERRKKGCGANNRTTCDDDGVAGEPIVRN